jgi:hypothetical protein
MGARIDAGIEPSRLRRQYRRVGGHLLVVVDVVAAGWLMGERKPGHEAGRDRVVDLAADQFCHRRAVLVTWAFADELHLMVAGADGVVACKIERAHEGATLHPPG